MNILPIFIALSIGFFLGNIFPIDLKSISRVAFYIFSPCLVFQLITENELNNNDILIMGSYTLLTTFFIVAIVFIVGKRLKYDRKRLAAIMLPVTIVNAGNYGLSLNEFAFGDETLAHASLFYVVMAILAYSLGIIIASSGEAPIIISIKELFKFPILYALLLSLIANQYNFSIPIPIERTINMLAGAAIPSMLILLGLQLQQVKWSMHIQPILVATSLRLGISPIIAILLSVVINLEGAAYQAGIIQASMPSAVMTTVLATEFDTEPGLVTAIVTLTTILSPLTLTPLLLFLGA